MRWLGRSVSLRSAGGGGWLPGLLRGSLARQFNSEDGKGTDQPVAADEAARREPAGSLGCALALVARSADVREADGVGAAGYDMLDELSRQARERLEHQADDGRCWRAGCCSDKPAASCRQSFVMRARCPRRHVEPR